MKTTFANALALCGLSQANAAEFFDVSLQTVKHWSSGRNNPPEGVWVMLAGLWRQIEDACDGAAAQIEIEGVDPRAWGRIEADLTAEPLPLGSKGMAGAMALLIEIQEGLD